MAIKMASTGKEGKLSQRAAVPTAKGGWKSRVTAINNLIDDLVRPTAEMARGELSGLIMKPYQLDDVLAKIALAIRSPATMVGGSKLETMSQ